MRAIRQLDTEQQGQVIAAYEALGVPSDRLPHTPDIRLMAEECGALEEEVWQFLLDSRGRKGGTTKLPEIKGRVIPRRAPLDPDHCEVFERQLGAPIIANAENFVYSDHFRSFVSINAGRSLNDWAYDLIRYRKWKATHDAGVMPQKGRRAARGAKTATEPTQAIIATHEKDRLAFIGPSPSPDSFVFLREIDDAECMDLQRSYAERRVTRNVYRVERHELEIDQEVVL